MLPAFKIAPIFVGLGDPALELLSARAQHELISPICPIVSEGEPGNTFYLITDGIVRVCKNIGQPGEAELAKLGVGDFFGEMCILETLPRTATVMSLTEVKLVSLNAMDFLQLFEQFPRDYAILLLNIARDLSRRLRNLDTKYAALLAKKD